MPRMCTNISHTQRAESLECQEGGASHACAIYLCTYVACSHVPILHSRPVECHPGRCGASRPHGQKHVPPGVGVGWSDLPGALIPGCTSVAVIFPRWPCRVLVGPHNQGPKGITTTCSDDAALHKNTWPCRVLVGPHDQGLKGMTTKQIKHGPAEYYYAEAAPRRKESRGTGATDQPNGRERPTGRRRPGGKRPARAQGGGGQARGRDGSKEPPIAEVATTAQATN